jgi:O-antigen/teichoic acid export membrane protein
MSRVRRAALTLVAGQGAAVGVILMAFFATPILVRGLGEERYGAYRVASDYLAYVALLELGLGASVSAALARARSDDRPGRVAVIARAGFRAFARVGALIAVGTAALIAATPWLVPTTPEVGADLRAGLCISLVALVLYPLGVCRALVDAGQRGYLIHAGLLAQAVVTTAVAVASVRVGWGLTGQFAAVAAGGVVFAGVITLAAVRTHPGAFAGGGSDPEAVAELGRSNRDNLIAGLLYRVGQGTETILVALFVGTAAVTPYVLTQRLANMVQGQLNGFGAATWAALTEMYHRGEHAALRVRLVGLTRLVVVAGLAALVPVVAGNRAFVRLWVGPGGDAGWAVTALAAAVALAQSLATLWGWQLVGIGRTRPTLPPLLVGSVLGLAAAVLLAPLLGLAGVLLGTVVQMGGVVAWGNGWLLRRELGVPLRALAGAIARPVLVTAPYGAVVIAVGAVWPPDQLDLPGWGRWAVLAGGMAAAAAGCLALNWVLVLPADERTELVSRVFRR